MIHNRCSSHFTNTNIKNAYGSIRTTDNENGVVFFLLFLSLVGSVLLSLFMRGNEMCNILHQSAPVGAEFKA